MTTPKPDIETEIRFLTSEEGGGLGPYRNRVNTTQGLGLGENLSDAMHFFPDKDQVKPGETVRSRMSFLYPQGHKGNLYESFAFTIQEGRRVIGQGCITKVLNEELKSP